jgi:hypothetical protein
MKILHMMPGFAALFVFGTLIVGVDPADGQLGTNAAVGDEQAAARVFGSCITNRTVFRTQTNQVQTLSPLSFRTMDNTHLPVTHAAGCLIVDFAGELHSNTNAGRIHIRAFITGRGVAEPPEALIGHSVEATEFETRSMRFVVPNVPAGTHTVRIEWLMDDLFGIARARNRTLTVQHR